MFQFFFSAILIIGLAFPSFGDNKLDSLISRIETFKEDTSKVNEIVKVCKLIENNYPDKTIEIANEGIKLSEILDYKVGLANCFKWIGIAFQDKGNYEMAVINYLKALKLFDELKDSDGVATAYNLLGIVCRLQSNYKQAIEYYKKALQLSKENGNKKSYASTLVNIGNVFYFSNDFKSALNYYKQAKETFEELGKKNEEATCLQNIGSIYFSQKKYDLALENYNKVLEVRVKDNDQSLIAVSLNNIGDVYKEKGDFQKAIEFLNKSIIISKKADAKETLRINYETLLDLYSKQGNYKEAINYFKLISDLKDTIFNIESNKNLHEISVKYESEKKESENKILRSEKERQKIINWSITTVLVLLATLVFFVSRSLRITRKQKRIIENQKQMVDEKNMQLNQQNEEISTQRDEIEAQRDLVVEQKEHIEEIHKGVTDSINYAKRIQEAVLPVSVAARLVLGEHFILFKPKDIVSGDFYWTTKIDNGASSIVVIAVADCTGHGVPGAFMSMLGISFLNEIVRKKEINKANEVLNQLRSEIINALQQKGVQGEQKDGMDISLLVVNNNTYECQWAGANNPLYIVRKFIKLESEKLKVESEKHTQYNDNANFTNFELEELKGDKMPIAIHPVMSDFTNHEFNLQKGDSVYLFSDGYADQFGGPKGRKFMYKKFKEILLANSNKSLNEQKEILVETFQNWKGEFEQVDDVTILGIKT